MPVSERPVGQYVSHDFAEVNNHEDTLSRSNGAGSQQEVNPQRSTLRDVSLNVASRLADMSVSEVNGDISVNCRWSDGALSEVEALINAVNKNISSSDMSVVDSLMTEFLLGAVEINYFNTDDLLLERIDQCAQILGVRSSGLIFAFQSSHRFSEFKDNLLFEKNYCQAHEIKKEMHGLSDLYNATEAYIKELKSDLSKKNKKILTSIEQTALKPLSDRLWSMVERVDQLESGSPEIAKYNGRLSYAITSVLKQKGVETNIVPSRSEEVYRDELTEQLKRNNPIKYSLIETGIALCQHTSDEQALESKEYKEWTDTVDYLFHNSHQSIFHQFIATSLISYHKYVQFLALLDRNELLGAIPQSIVSDINTLKDNYKTVSQSKVDPYIDGSRILCMYSQSKFDMEDFYESTISSDAKLLFDIKNCDVIPFHLKKWSFTEIHMVVGRQIKEANAYLKKYNGILEDQANTKKYCQQQLGNWFSIYRQAVEDILCDELSLQSSPNPIKNSKKESNKQNKDPHNAKPPQVMVVRNDSVETKLSAIHLSKISSLKGSLGHLCKSNNKHIHEVLTGSSGLDEGVWISESHYKVIKQFVCGYSSASYIIPPRQGSSIKKITSSGIPFLNSVNVYPSREVDTGETIDQHILRRRPEFYRYVWQNESQELHPIEKFSRVILAVLSNIKNAWIDSDSLYRPERNITIRFPRLFVEGKYKGVPVQVVFSKPFNHCLGLEPFELNKTMVARSIIAID